MEAKRRKLLLADDSITIQKVVSLTFSDEGMDVLAVGTGDRALTELEETGPPDIVLADVHMPGLNGYELCERIKQDARWRHVPVILLAGAFEPFDEAEARRVGADEVLSKPFQSIRDLIGKVGSLLGGKPEAGREDSKASHEQTRAGADAPHGVAAGARVESRAEATSNAGASEAGAQLSSREPAAPLADLGMDDQMIEATPAESFGSAVVERHQASAASNVVNDFGAHDAEDEWAGERRDTQTAAAATHKMTAQEVAAAAPQVVAAAPQVVAAVTQEAGAESYAPKPAFAAHAASAAAADDVLLDLGGIETSPSSAEADDFILDLDFDETPARSPRAYAEPAPAPQYAADAAGLFAEAAHGPGSGAARAETQFAQGFAAGQVELNEKFAAREFVEPQVVPADEHRQASEDLSVEGDVARPPLEVAAPAPASDDDATGVASVDSSIDPRQLSPEVIDAIARRAVEMLSERVVQQIAWDVVPELAERLIRQRLDQQK